MNTKKLWIIVGIVSIFLMGYFAYYVSPKAPTDGVRGVVCTADAKMCPDGSSVGRIGSDCHFATCPVSNASSTQTTGTLNGSIGITSSGYSFRITPIKVVEDSRCPMGVMCIQAGTVRLEATVSVDGLKPDLYTFILGNPVVIDGKSITLTEVTPVKRAGSDILSGEYGFIFEISSADDLFDSKG